MNPHVFLNMIGFHGLIALFILGALVTWFRPELWLHAFFGFLAALTGWASASTNEVQLAVLLLFVFGFFAGVAEPKRAWQFALLLALGVPVFDILAQRIHAAPGDRFSIAGVIMPLVFSFAGAYSGVLLKRFSIPSSSSAQVVP